MAPANDFKNYYAILGVSKTATADDIKRAYRKLARKHHPDVNPGNQEAEEKFKAINEANEVLSNPETREKYDQFGQYWKQAGEGTTPPRTGTTSQRSDQYSNFDQYSSFDDFINDLLGGSGGRTRTGRTYYRTSPQQPDDSTGFGTQAPAPDTEAAIALSLSEAFHGVQKRLQLDDETINIRIPPGAKPGSRIRIKGKGRPSSFSQQRGDLYLTINLLPHPFFQFSDNNLSCEVPIRPDEAVLGAQIQVPTPDGRVTLAVPKGVNSGQLLRLRGKGWTQPKDGRTDLIVKLQIVSPKELSTIEQDCYEKIQANTSFNPRTALEEVTL
ncbi:J domain-containing protein [Aetokthonos hydrillicola Thurmond2011]|jgi:curved DNA-binding protein|uniref:J domain-containing protein n=1 Tax=Aetokthonos hydrillicola Thurmond2011 TaxID=2712845 RepID=A0AAP5MBM6_9CYAN|nr:J domain-containing protein [Aetokthonos hydrillicola]MBO3458628.1 J domain-containing protein [Aetokthonos hydrillicola CCALA 1050]MBW4587981.1 J domain-containing protein [Aetokthonos hydrillicola CCALA 1050]MDR9897064.1 J domain-containing protein [Aetokthonos hydrillicola Thurmond2011]